MLTAMVEVMNEAYKRGWITTRDGNCALSNHGNFYITPSGQRKNVLRVEDLIKYTTDDKGDLTCKEENMSPSIEFDSHYGLHRLANKKVISTLHLHPTNVVAAMYAGWNLQKLHEDFAELHRYTNVGKTVRQLPPGDEMLAVETIKNMQMGENSFCDIVGQKGHGVMAIGKNPWDAFEHIERLDHICKIVLISGVKPNS
jgi:ribulose-5-phosphate 4-epimerase/fuculose-1-phosphate aldolase